MRVLLLMRGAPGAGKSTFIKENDLEQYVLSSDEIRLMYQSPMLQVNGTEAISPANDKAVWDTLFQLLEARMQRGEFVVVDATNSKTSEMTKYKKLSDTYRYRIYLVDFTDLPIEECKSRNAGRPPYKRVPDYVIDNMYARFANQNVPAGITVIKPEELDTIWYKPCDVSSYNKIHHIGDIHGCNTALQEYLKDGLKDDELYIFCGDYVDRGIENAAVVRFLYSIMDKPNVILLEGNHERWLWCWGNGETAKSREFESVTRKELEREGVNPKMARMLYRKLYQCVYYKYNDKFVLVTHAGLSCIPDNLTKVATEQMIRGVGKYEEYKAVAESFDRLMPDNCYQVFGHRNTEDSPIRLSERCFDLEGKIEFGGELRAVVLDNNGFHPVSVKNNVFKPLPQTLNEYTATEKSVMETINKMRQSRYVREKKYGDISSFNFTREVFYDKKWNEQTITARGLFINTSDGTVVARSYPKFFAINERQDTRLDTLKYKLKFPITAYVKENGFLGLVSYNTETDDFFISSKSDIEGNYAGYIRNMFRSIVKFPDKLKDYLKQTNVTLVFECVDTVNDPHIIKYDKSHLFLLDIVKNDIVYTKLPYEKVVDIANRFGFEAKTRTIRLNDWNEFSNWYTDVLRDDYLYEGRQIEGFVLEDTAGLMLKVKLAYYAFWKHMRAVAHETLKSGNYRHTGSLTTPLGNEFFGFCKKLYGTDNPPTNIIELREMFYKQKGENNDQ